jgi:chromosome segregation ATPase
VFLEVSLKTLQIIFFILLCATPLHAGQALVLTEIEQIQEKIWHLQRAVATQNTSIEEQQKQLELFIIKADGVQLALDEQITLLSQSISSQQDKTKLLAAEFQDLHAALTTLTNEVGQSNSAALEQTEKNRALERSLQRVRAEFTAKQTGTEQELAETRKQLIEIRSQLDALGQNVGGRIEQISLWGAGAGLFIIIVLTIVLVGRRDKSKGQAAGRKLPPRHEM